LLADGALAVAIDPRFRLWFLALSERHDPSTLKTPARPSRIVHGSLPLGLGNPVNARA